MTLRENIVVSLTPLLGFGARRSALLDAVEAAIKTDAVVLACESIRDAIALQDRTDLKDFPVFVSSSVLKTILAALDESE